MNSSIIHIQVSTTSYLYHATLPQGTKIIQFRGFNLSFPALYQLDCQISIIFTAKSKAQYVLPPAFSLISTFTLPSIPKHAVHQSCLPLCCYTLQSCFCLAFLHVFFLSETLSTDINMISSLFQMSNVIAYLNSSLSTKYYNNPAIFFFIALPTTWHICLFSVSPTRTCILWDQTVNFCSLLKCARHRVDSKYLWNKWMNSLAYLNVDKWLLTSMKALYYLQWMQGWTHYPLNSGLYFLWWLKHQHICLS